MLQLQFGAVLVLSLALHGYYLYSYTQKPSVIDPTLAWKDYFDLNAILQAKYPRVPVIGLSDPKGSGLEYPVAQEVTTSFSIPAHTVIHTRLSWEQFRVLRKIMNSGHSLPYAGAMGYQYIVWGPVEERGWGAATRKRFISSENLVERVGTVSLYRYADTLRSRFAAETDTSSPQFYLKVADAFANEGWKDEAFGYYFQALKLNPDFIEGHVHLAQALEQENRDSEAKEHREFAEKIRERLDRRSLGQRSDGG